ncbi:hypothetical protein NQZ68_021048 [Dissostichus eleginoides]|nr:hypothetical protein NQZ68_021048 [Dissostichus eleginoides]
MSCQLFPVKLLPRSEDDCSGEIVTVSPHISERYFQEDSDPTAFMCSDELMCCALYSCPSSHCNTGG